MAIIKSFGGASISKTGAYSKYAVDNSGGAPLEANTVLFLLGESTKGKSGATEGITEWNATQLGAAVAYYGNGPIVDAMLKAVNPSKTQGVQGAGKILVYKTNATTQATLTVNEATNTNPLIVIADRAYGVSGNDVSITIANGTNATTQKQITINKIGFQSEILPQNAGTAQLSIQYTGDATSATMAITGASKAAKTLAITLSGQTDGTLSLSLPLQNLTMKQVADQINGTTGYSCTLLNTASGTVLGATDLDLISGVNAKVASSLYRLQEEIIAVINTNSAIVSASLHATPRVGLPVNVTNVFLTGGAQGASTNSNFSTGLAKSLSKTYNVALPCISQDATADILMGSVGNFVTDSSSSYTIASVIAALSSHLNTRATIKTKKEAQGMVGFRASTKAAVKAQAQTTANFLIQLAMQDCYVLDQTGNLTWKQPHVTAAMFSGIRLGTEVGTPLTYKVLDVNNLGHYVDPVTGIEGGDFIPETDYDEIIEAGITYCEKVPAGWRIVVDNTTYGADQSFVYNRGSVVEVVNYVNKTLRDTADLIYIGNKGSNGLASAVKASIGAKLKELNKANMITASDDGAPFGYKEKTFVVLVQGNTIYVAVEYKPTQGVDFVFFDFLIGDITQSA